MHVHFVRCAIFDVKHWNITQKCNKYNIFFYSSLCSLSGLKYNIHMFTNGSAMAKWLTRDRVAAGSSLTGVTVLCP